MKVELPERRRHRVSRYPVFESVSGWARILGIPRHRLRHLLNSTTIVCRKHGRTRVVYLSDWRKMDPELWESILLRDTMGEAEEETG